MTIPQNVLDAYAAIQASNPIPDITVLPISQTTLSATEAQLAGWQQCLALTEQQTANARANVQTLQAQVEALKALLGVG